MGRLIHAKAAVVLDGVTYEFAIQADNNDKKLQDLEDKLLGMATLVGKAAARARLQFAIGGNTPAGEPVSDGGDTVDNEGVAMTGTENFVISAIAVQFGKNGGKETRVKGGRFSRHGVRLWPEHYDWLSEIGFTNDPESLDAGDYQKGLRKGAMMTVTKDTDGHFHLNRLYIK